jgi:hypothetical protein
LADNETLDPVEQAELAAKLQSKWLRRMETLLDNGTINATEMAVLARVLLQNGWEFDLAKLAGPLRDKLTSHVSPEELEQDGILPMRKSG